MSRILTGDEGFKYAYITVRRQLPLEKLARVARAGDLRLVVNHYSVAFEDGEQALVYLEDLRSELGLPADEDRGIYEAEDHDVTVQELFQKMVEQERKVTVPTWQEQYPDPPVTQLDVFAHVQYRFYRDTDWTPMLAYLNSKLPEGTDLGLEEIKGLSSELLAQFDPEQHEPNREDGTGFLMWFLEQEEDECLPYLGFRILVHAVTHDLEMLDIDDEPNWRKQLFPVIDGSDGKAKTAKAKTKRAVQEKTANVKAKTKKAATPPKATARKTASPGTKTKR